MSADIPPEVRQEVAGALGSLVALSLSPETKCARLVLYAVGGWGMSWAFGDSVQGWTGAPADMSHALAGLFGLAIVERALVLIRSVDSKKIANTATDAVNKRIKGD